MNKNRFASCQPRGGALLKVLFVLALLFVVVAIAWVVLLPSLVASTIHSRTGFTVKIEKLSINPFMATAQIGGLVLENPPDWPEKDFVEIRQFKADVRPWSVFSGKFVANDVVADVAQITVVRNQQGVLNATAFSNGLTGPAGKGAAPSQPSAQPPSKSRGFLIHHLSLKFDTLVLADYSRGQPFVKKYALNVNQEMTEVDSVAKLISPLTGQALNVAAAAFGGLNPKDAGALNDAVETLQNAGKKAGESLKNLFRSLDNKKP